jgi:hypothetical protein
MIRTCGGQIIFVSVSGGTETKSVSGVSPRKLTPETLKGRGIPSTSPQDARLGIPSFPYIRINQSTIGSTGLFELRRRIYPVAPVHLPDAFLCGIVVLGKRNLPASPVTPFW